MGWYCVKVLPMYAQCLPYLRISTSRCDGIWVPSPTHYNAHNNTLQHNYYYCRCIYAYFMGVSEADVSQRDFLSHHIYELSPGPFGCTCALINPLEQSTEYAVTSKSVWWWYWWRWRWRKRLWWRWPSDYVLIVCLIVGDDSIHPSIAQKVKLSYVDEWMNKWMNGWMDGWW